MQMERVPRWASLASSGGSTTHTSSPLGLILTLPDWGCLLGSNWEEGLDLLFPER